MLGFLQAVRAMRTAALGATTSRKSFSTQEPPSMPEQLEALNKLINGNETSVEQDLQRFEHFSGARDDRQPPSEFDPSPVVFQSQKPTEPTPVADTAEADTNDTKNGRTPRLNAGYYTGC